MPAKVIVLGPPDIHSPDPLLLGPSLGRLLGILVAKRDQLTRSPVLVDKLWPDRAPGSGEAALRVQITRLRRHLGSSDAIVVSPGRGYRLASDSEVLTVDADEFRLSVQRGDEAVQASDHSTAATHYRTALRLWNGAAFDGCEDDADVQIASAGLDALRRRARRSLVDLLVRAGDCASASIDLTEIHGLLAEQPDDEELAAMFMERLEQLDQPGEALRVYQRTETHLRADLGVGPSSRMREVVERLSAMRA